MLKKYIINKDGFAVTEPDLMVWAQWMETELHKYHKQDEIAGISISTIFLGLDHSFDPKAEEPVLWETMVFDNDAAYTTSLGKSLRTVAPALDQVRHKFMHDAYEYHNNLVRAYQKRLDEITNDI